MWAPHFQIDLDTSLSFNELEKITDDSLGSRFFKWKLNIPNYGIVLGMGILGKIGNTKICLGLGTDIRDTKYQREMLKEV